jgi:hypothetical protein
MKKIIGIIFLITFLFILISGCTVHNGISIVKKDMERMPCTANSVNIDTGAAKEECMKIAINEEFYKNGCSIATFDMARDIDRVKYRACMKDRNINCVWEPLPRFGGVFYGLK